MLKAEEAGASQREEGFGGSFLLDQLSSYALDNPFLSPEMPYTDAAGSASWVAPVPNMCHTHSWNAKDRMTPWLFMENLSESHVTLKN